MAVGAVLAAALTDHSAHPKVLTVAGVDLIRKPGTGGNGYGVPIESVQVTEAGPGSVSVMTFTIEDPLAEVAISNGDWVRFEDTASGLTIFGGWVQTNTKTPNGIGRDIAVNCIGAEKWLDWAVLPADLSFTGNEPTYHWSIIDVAQAVVANVIGMGVAINDLTLPGVSTGSQVYPIANQLANYSSIDNVTFTIAAGSTARQAIMAAWDHLLPAHPQVPLTPRLALSVDANLGLRMWLWPRLFGNIPSDYAALSIVDTTAGAVVATDPAHTLDGTGIIRTVQIVGGNAAGSGMFTDGTGMAGQARIVTDTSILTASAAYERAVQVIAYASDDARGEFSLSDLAAVAVHPGSQVTITDANLSLSAVSYFVSEIRKSFNPSGREDWTVAYGRAPASYVDAA